MNVSFTPLNLVEAQSITVKYTVLYSPQYSRKRQVLEADVPNGQNYVVVRGLDPGTSYNVMAMVTNNGGSDTSKAKPAHAPCE